MTKIAIKSDKITPFGGIFWSHAPIWPLALAGHWFYPRGEVQILRISVQRNPALAHVHLLLRRLMRWGPQLTPYKPPFASPKAPHLQRRHHSKGDKRACSEQHILRFGCRQTICFQYGRKAQWVDVQLLDGNRATQGRRLYDLDFDHQFIEVEKFESKPTFKKCLGYRPGVAVIGDTIVGIENSDGNTNVRFHQKDTLKRFFERL